MFKELIKHRTELLGLFLVITLLLVLFTPTFRWLWHEWWTNDYYSHGVLVPLVSAFFFWRRWPQIKRAFSNWGLLGLTAGLGLYLYGLSTSARYLIAFSFIIVLVGLTLFLWGVHALRMLWFPIAFLGFMVPLPFVEQASFPLQTFTARQATELARLLGVPAQYQGAQVILPELSLSVGAPCSGLRSIVALLTLMAVFLYIIQGPWRARFILVILALPLAIVANVIRVASLLVVAHTWGAAVGLKYYHDFSGLVFFLIAFGLIIGLSWVAGCRKLRHDL